VAKRQACKNFKLALIPEYGKISRDGGKLKQNFRIFKISELRRRQELLGDLLWVDHGISASLRLCVSASLRLCVSASLRLCASLFFINDQFYQWNSVVDKPVSLD
jgi:hypothetical protein